MTFLGALFPKKDAHITYGIVDMSQPVHYRVVSLLPFLDSLHLLMMTASTLAFLKNDYSIKLNCC